MNHMHVDFSVLLYSLIVNKLPEKEVHDLFKEAIEIEIYFITESIKCSLIGMNSDKMIQYIKSVSDRLLEQLGYSKLYNVSCPFCIYGYDFIGRKNKFF